MKIDQFNSVFSSMTGDYSRMTETKFTADIRQRAVRLLDSLGHCEFDFDSRTVWVCKPSFFPLPAFGLPKCVLAGARTPALIKKLKTAVAKRSLNAALRLDQLISGGISLPTRISVEAASNDILGEIASDAGVEFYSGEPAAWRMVNSSASLDDVRKSAKFEERESPNWVAKVFLTEDLLFRNVPEKRPDIVKLVQYKSPIDQQMRHWIWDGNVSTDVDRDWGRYWVLSSADQNVLIYDRRRNRFAVPVFVPLPPLLARSLTLCSGAAPEFATLAGDGDGKFIHIYEDVTPAIAEAVGSKLGQGLVYADLEPDEEGVINA